MNYPIEIMHFKRCIVFFLLAFIFLSCKVQKTTPNDSKSAETENSKVWGIDISHYQEVYDWERLKEHEPGFIFVKASEGSTIQDPKYAEYYKTIRKLDIPVGSYHFFTYKTSGKDQAKNFLSVAKLQRGDLPLVLDAEFAKTMPDKKTINKELLDFVSVVYAKTKHYPIIYCAYKYYLLYLKDFLPEKCKLWIVDYRGKPDCDWTFWQIAEKYKVAGIKGYVDYNLFYGSKKELESMRL
jgi:lysozyme